MTKLPYNFNFDNIALLKALNKANHTLGRAQRRNQPFAESVYHFQCDHFRRSKENGFLSANHIIRIHHIVEPEAGDIRKLPGTVIKNAKTGAVLHTPPQNYEEISDYLANLEKYINTNEFEDIDAILKMAVIHFQFESIHPFDTYLFYDFYTKNEYLCEKLNISRIIQKCILI